ncbi:MAG TPA: XRE family transcriptional regulator [Candidatus Atribacteria bacterium]|nr:XRE family transcriptional regulator [Candidatus Atribacteria bacterium]
MIFGEKLRKLREARGITQQELAKRLGYVTNSYIADVEKGKFTPSRKKLREIGKALGVSFKEIEGLLIETKIEEFGVKESELISLFRDIPRLPREDKKAIIKAYLKIKEKRKHEKNH